MSERSEIATAADRDDTVSLLDLVRVLVRRRWLIVGLTVIGALLIFGVLLLSLLLPSSSRWNPLPEIYRPEARVLLVEASGGASLLDNLSGAGLAGLAQLSGLGGSGHSAELAQELLAGRTLHDRIIDEFDFAGRYQLPASRARAPARGPGSRRRSSTSTSPNRRCWSSSIWIPIPRSRPRCWRACSTCWSSGSGP